jgi:hypothetical protein
VVRDRLISMTDPQARHGRKSKSRLFNGFKLHAVGDLVSGLIASVTVTTGSQHDAVPTHRLVRRAKTLFRDIEQMQGDTAYGGTRARQMIKQSLGVDLLAPPSPEPQPKAGKVAKSDFSIDFTAKSVTCPGGVTSNEFDVVHHWEYDLPAHRYKWSKQACDSCPLRAGCLRKGLRSKRLLLHPLEKELRDHRAAWQDSEVRKRYRRRGEFERLIHTAVRHGGRRARAWGLSSANLQAHAIVATSNLCLLAKTLAAEGRPPETPSLTV